MVQFGFFSIKNHVFPEGILLHIWSFTSQNIEGEKNGISTCCPLFWLVGFGCFALFIDTMKYLEYDQLQPLKTLEYNSFCFIVIVKTDLFACFPNEIM